MGKVINLENIRRKRMGDKQMERFVEKQEGTINILNVADYFLNCSKNTPGTSITPLKLQKLCYYAQAWSLVWDGEQLFEEDFEAWVHGPANYKLYIKYGDYYRNQSINLWDVDIDCMIFTEKQIQTMDMIWESYGHHSGHYLEDLTHQEDPWIYARKDIGVNSASSNLITKQSIYEYYSKFM